MSDTAMRWILKVFPRSFRERMAADVVDTMDDALEAASTGQRSRLRRRLLAQLAWAAAVERVHSWIPSPRPTSHHERSSFLEDCIHDLRGALGTLLRKPAFSSTVIATLAIGLGSSTAMFTVVHGVLMEPLPYADSERLVMLYRHYTHRPEEGRTMSLPDLRDVQEAASTLDGIIGYYRDNLTLLTDGTPELASFGRTTNGLLEIFSVEPVLGRDLTAEDAASNAEPSVVLAYGLWQRRYGGDPSVLGTRLDISGEAHTVVGVGPQGFGFPDGVQGWLPSLIDTEHCGRSCHAVSTVGRLAPNVDVQAATDELTALGIRLGEAFPETNAQKRFGARTLLAEAVAPVQSTLWILLGAVQLVVLIAAANVANLVLVRGTQRRRELAVRSALGADRQRLFRQLMLENTLLTIAGGVAGLVVGQVALTGLLRLAPDDLPRVVNVALDTEAYAFITALALAVLLIFGLFPAMGMARTEIRSRAIAGTVTGKQSRLALLTVETALALVLLLGAGLMLRSYGELTRIDLGFNPEGITRFFLELPDATYDSDEKIDQFTRALEASLSSIPGVEGSALAFAGPLGDNYILSVLTPLDRPAAADDIEYEMSFDAVTPDFFETLQIEVLRGRVFSAQDRAEAPRTLVVSRTLAERYYPDKDPIGEQVKFAISFSEEPNDAPYTIVGVVEDVRAYSLTDAPHPAIYAAQAQTFARSLNVMVRTRPGVDVLPAVNERLRALDPALPVRAASTHQGALAEAFGPQRFYLALLTAFASIALVLSAIGLYSVVSFLTGQRTRELAVRMALGADARRVVRLVLRDAIRPALIGTACGLLGAAFAARLLESQLYGISSLDALTYATAPLILLTVTLAATLAPALRATRIQAQVALREEGV
ncbi:MAG: ABC transporter permease [Acidobacteriota bacterium]